MCDRIEHHSVTDLDELVALLDQRGVGRTFLVQMAQHLQDHRTPNLSAHNASSHHDWLHRALPDLAAAQAQQPADPAADNLSVSNAIGSLRLIGNADWPDIICHTSATMQSLLGSPALEAERDDTRDATLHQIEVLARQSRRTETAVAQTLLDLMHREGGLGASTAASHWLHGAGRPALMRRLDLNERATVLWRALQRRAALPAYLATLAGGTLAIVAWLLMRHSVRPGPGSTCSRTPVSTPTFPKPAAATPGR